MKILLLLFARKIDAFREIFLQTSLTFASKVQLIKNSVVYITLKPKFSIGSRTVKCVQESNSIYNTTVKWQSSRVT